MINLDLGNGHEIVLSDENSFELFKEMFKTVEDIVDKYETSDRDTYLAMLYLYNITKNGLEGLQKRIGIEELEKIILEGK